MGYTLNKKNINLDKKFRLNTDSLSDVYMLNRGIAVRVFKENIDRSLVLSEYECEFISKLRCDNMLMPKQLLYKNNKYEGYSFRNINKVRKDKIISTNKKDLVADLEMIEEDLDVLSNAYVMLDGITPRNVVYSDGLYITDVSQFKVLNKNEIDYRDLRKLNDFQIQLLFESLVAAELKRERVESKKIKYLLDLIEKRDDNTKQSRYYEDLFEYSDNIKQFVKKL